MRPFVPSSNLLSKPPLELNSATERSFDLAEMELVRRWAIGEVPTPFINRPVEHLRRMVNAWWHIYHESAAASQGRNRTVFERSPGLPAGSLSTASLLNNLGEIRQLIQLDGLSQYRPIHQHEQAAVHLLVLITEYYEVRKNESPTE